MRARLARDISQKEISLTRPKKPAKNSPGSGEDGAIAKVFWSGRSQAVRLPKEFRVQATELKIRKIGHALLLEPVRVGVDRNGWPLGFFDIFGTVGDDFDLGDRSAPAERPNPLGDDD
jgi:antitoxin VapB